MKCADNRKSLVAVVINHLLWFRYFSTPPEVLLQRQAAKGTQAYGRGSTMHDYSSSDPYYTNKIPKFSEISAFFGLCGKSCITLTSFLYTATYLET